jgi:hypothetical protein
MKTALMGVVLLMAAYGVSAQEDNGAPSRTNAAAPFSETSASQTRFASLNIGDAANSTVTEAAAESNATPEPAPDAPAAPAPTPKYLFGERDDYRFQLAVGFDYFRFQSNAFDANLFGLNTTLTYYTNSWFGVEGNVTTGFSNNTLGYGHEKIVGGLGGIRIGGRRQKWEPWAHALVGGAHEQPQTPLGGRNGLMAIAGGGVDYRVHARLSFRVEGDWVHTAFFSQNQENVQVIGAVVLHF